MNDAQTSFLKRSAIGAITLFAVYMVVMTLANSFTVALGELGRWWTYIAPLSAGFGVQVGLYLHLRDVAKAGAGGLQGSRMAVGGGVSATSMVVCCLHHVTDFLPLVGLSAATLFLADYQSVFMSLGVLSSVVGTLVMLEKLQSMGAGGSLSAGLGRLLAWYDIPRIKKVSLVASSFIFIVILAGTIGSAPGAMASPDDSTVIGSEAGVTFTIKSVEYGDAIGFQMKIDTHQGALSFDLTEITTLVVGGTAYEPLSWEGSPPGGHHRSGELFFPKPREAGFSRLVIRDVNGVAERVFVFGADTTASMGTYVLGGVTGITFIALFLAYRSRRSPEEYYQGLFEAEQRRYRL